MNPSTPHPTSALSENPKSRIWADPLSIRLGVTEFLLYPNELCLKKVRVDGELLIEAVYVAVRNANWDTGFISLRTTSIEAIPDGGVRVQWQAQIGFTQHELNPPIYEWQISLTLGKDTLRFEARGVALQNFMRNRIGLCVLLPDTLAGCTYSIEHSVLGRQTSQSGRLPVDISPHQPIFDIANLQIEASERLLTLDFSGDVFEMEDQRNWTDASYKIYSTPLALPFPVEVAVGETLVQCFDASWVAEIDRANGKAGPTAGRSAASEFCVDWQSVVTPTTAIGFKYFGEKLDGRLADVRPNFVQLELMASQWRNQPSTILSLLGQSIGHLREIWAQDVGIVMAVREPLQMTGQDWKALKANVDLIAAPLKFQRVVALLEDVPGNCLRAVSREWVSTSADVLKDTRLCISTTRYFAELNRAQQDLAQLGLQAVGYGITPQVHVFGGSEMFDTLGVQSRTARQAQQFAPDIHWWSVTMNPLHFSGEDWRLHSNLGAAWWLGSFIEALRGGVHSAAWFALDGPWGICIGSPLHRIMVSIRQCVSEINPSTSVEIFNGAAIRGLRIGDAAWLVNCRDTPTMGWLSGQSSDSGTGQVWLAPWQILRLPASVGKCAPTEERDV